MPDDPLKLKTIFLQFKTILWAQLKKEFWEVIAVKSAQRSALPGKAKALYAADRQAKEGQADRTATGTSGKVFIDHCVSEAADGFSQYDVWEIGSRADDGLQQSFFCKQ